MPSGRGITVHSGAIDFSALARPAPPTSLVSRAASNTTRRIWIITGIVILVSLVVGGIFCCVVLGLMYKKKQERKKRNIDLGGTNANHRYRPVEDMELGYQGVQELPAENYGLGYKAELPSDVNEVPKVQQLDGYIAPAKADIPEQETMVLYYRPVPGQILRTSFNKKRTID
ncbi:hypothetical protein N0V90_004234 [Kalmusia sp. IMI 367209]|nr:hypothetical protein N0V90_004234 [Kalmusia sp. IMI 367209]